MFSLRQLVRSTPRAITNVRHMASSGPLVDLTVDKDGIAILTMQRPPVNSLNLDMLAAIRQGLDDVAKDKSKALILTSASPTVFSAGLDIMEMYKPDMQRVKEFWTTLQDVWIKLFGSSFITAAAINGHAPAGGCLLAMSCEYRAMVQGKYTIGLNETALGMVAPTWFMDTMRHTISDRESEIALTSAKLYTVEEALKVSNSQRSISKKYTIGLNEVALGIPVPTWVIDTMRHTISDRESEIALASAKLYTFEEALKVGLIDETATDKADAIEKCKLFIKRFDRIPGFARSVTKLSIREAPLKKLMTFRKQDVDTFVGFVKDEKTQLAMGMYIENLKKKASQGKK